MEEYARLIRKLVATTEKDSLEWAKSSVIEGYIAKVGLSRIEVLKPYSSQLAIINRAVEVALDPLKHNINDVIVRENWRLVIYDDAGSVQSTILEQDFLRYPAPEVPGYPNPIRYLYKEISEQFRRRERKSIKEVLDGLDLL